MFGNKFSIHFSLSRHLDFVLLQSDEALRHLRAVERREAVLGLQVQEPRLLENPNLVYGLGLGMKV